MNRITRSTGDLFPCFFVFIVRSEELGVRSYGVGKPTDQNVGATCVASP